MKPPALNELPAPPGAACGWPWTEPPLPPHPRADWPKISIVTPSFNQGRYLEETIRSVLLQGYPNLEYYVIDGGSNDQSVEIIRKYAPWLSGWVSERDSGQSEAINKGFARSNGDIFNWVCSDDLLAPGALRRVADAFADQPHAGAVVGDCYCQYDHDPGQSGRQSSSLEQVRRAPYGFAVWQPSCFFRRTLINRSRLVREDLHYCMDRELWCHLQSQGTVWRKLDAVLSINRFTGENKSLVGGRKIIGELETMYRDYARRGPSLVFWLKQIWLPLVLTHRRHRSSAIRFASRWTSRGVTLGLKLFFPTHAVRILQKEYYRYAS